MQEMCFAVCNSAAHKKFNQTEQQKLYIPCGSMFKVQPIALAVALAVALLGTRGRSILSSRAMVLLGGPDYDMPFLLTKLSAIAVAVGLMVLCFCNALAVARKKAWNWACKTDFWQKSNISNKKLFVLPAIEHEIDPNHHIDVVHKPMYIARLLYFLAVAIPRFLILQLYLSLFPRDISDEQVFDLVSKSSIMLTAELSKDGKELDVTIPHNTGCTLILLPSSPCYDQMGGLRIVFDVETKTIKAAVGGNGAPVIEGAKHYSRNAQLVSMIGLHHGTCVHPASHAASERCVKEICENQVEELEPSSRFVLGLHQGLFYNTLSPIADSYTGLTTFLGTVAGMRHNIDHFPVPVHNLDARKAKISPFYRFLACSHRIVIKLVRKYHLNVNPEYLFQNLVVHSVDHCSSYDALKPMEGLYGLQGTNSFRDLYSTCCHINFWMLPLENPFESELVRNMEHPFYQELFALAREINPYYASFMCTSCSF